MMSYFPIIEKVTEYTFVSSDTKQKYCSYAVDVTNSLLASLLEESHLLVEIEKRNTRGVYPIVRFSKNEEEMNERPKLNNDVLFILSKIELLLDSITRKAEIISLMEQSFLAVLNENDKRSEQCKEALTAIQVALKTTEEAKARVIERIEQYKRILKQIILQDLNTLFYGDTYKL